MPVYFYWGEDDFALTQAIKELQQSIVDPDWVAFNFEQISEGEPLQTALNQAMTPVFGMGQRLVWVAESSICQQSSPEILEELERTLPQIPPTSHLLFSSHKKPDGRLKTTKLLQKLAIFREFSLLAPWQTTEILNQIQKMAQSLGVKLTAQGEEQLAEAVGNNTRQLFNELQKLALYQQSQKGPITETTLSTLVSGSSQNSLQLAEAMRTGKHSLALGLVQDLLTENEHPLKIVATLVNQFRTWTVVKLMLEAGERDDKVIAKAAEIANPKRIYFLRQAIQNCRSSQLLATLPLLLELEWQLKQGGEPLSTLQTKIIQICDLFQSS